MIDQRAQRIDALIITALYEELTALLSIPSDLSPTWGKKFDDQGFPYHVAEFTSKAGGPPLIFGAAWSGHMGETATAERSEP